MTTVAYSLTPQNVAQPLATFPPSYLYLSFNDDIYLQAMVDAQNQYQAAYLAAFNSLNLPIYTVLPSSVAEVDISSDGALNTFALNMIALNAGGDAVYSLTEFGLLDWVLTNLYGIPHPVFGEITAVTQTGGGYDTWEYDGPGSLYNDTGFNYTYSYTIASDDQYQRVATWNLYWGDALQPYGIGEAPFWSRQFNVRWLKRRVLRFLTGINGTDPGIDQTYLISVTCSPGGFVIACDPSLGAGNIQALTDALNGRFLGVPFIYVYTVT